MIKTYKSAWWSIDLPASWNIEAEKDCVSVTSKDDVGVLQIRAYRRDGKEVTNNDLLHFAEDELVEGVELENINCGEFTGIGISYLVDANYRRKWWLWKGSLLLYVTYNCSEDRRFVEMDTVDQIMSSLKNEPF